jgi:hypothetical protein
MSAPPVAPQNVIASIKGFGLDWKCRDFQFEIGQTYTHAGKVEACAGGFHAIEGYPLEVFEYYPPGQSLYADVKQSGKMSRETGDSKVASAKITIEAELKIPEIVKRAVAWVIAQTTPAKSNHAEGDRSAASSAGDRSAASSTGYRSAASSTGNRSAASSTGDRSAASSTGNRSAAMSAGFQGRVQGAEGCALFLVYRDDDYNILHAWAGIAGKNGILPNVWYTLNAKGQPVEVVA